MIDRQCKPLDPPLEHSSSPAPGAMGDATHVYLDVSQLPPPEPLQLGLEALLTLTAGQYLHFHHRRYPVLLYDRLAARGFCELTRRGAAGTCEVFIWQAEDELSRKRAALAAAPLAPWKEEP